MRPCLLLGYVEWLGFFLACSSEQQQNSKHNGHIGNVEDSGVEWPQLHVQEIGYAAEQEAIDHVPNAPAEDQCQADNLKTFETFKVEEKPAEQQQENRNPHVENPKTCRAIEAGAQTQKRSRVVCVSKLDEAVQIRERPGHRQ